MGAGFKIRAGKRGFIGLFVLLFSCLMMQAHAESTDVSIEILGVPPALRDNVSSYVGKVSSDELNAWRNTRVRLNDSVRDALQSEGYYSPDYQIERHDGGIVITINPGEPVRVRTLSLVFKGEAGNDIAFTALREHLSLKPGDAFHHGHYEALKSSVQVLATEKGYFEGEWLQHEVSVHVPERQADITLVYDSGRRYEFGPVSFLDREGRPQTVVRPELMQRFLTFEEGQPYEADQVIRLNRSLLNSRFFSDVRVHVERDKAIDNDVPVEVVVAAERPNNVDLGVGYSTDIKARISAKWQRPLINERGHGVETNAELSPVRSSFDAKYNIPLTHPIEDILQYFYGVKREEVEDEVVNWNTVLGVQRLIKHENGWQRTYSLRWNRDTTETPIRADSGIPDVLGPIIDTETLKTDLVLPGISFDRTRLKGTALDPVWGDRQFYQAEVASTDVLSDASLVSLRAGLRVLRTLAGKHQFLLRGDAGATLTNDFDAVPQSMRFFAGGDQSVRGYAYKSISPRDENGVAVGARNLLTGTLEYSYEFIPRWRLAVFTDAGDAFDALDNVHVYIGSGAGIRWVTPVGPIRLDFAWAVSEPERDFRIHFSMGPNL